MIVLLVPLIITILVLSFFRLAKKYNRDTISYGTLGVLVYFICFMIAEVVSNIYLTFLQKKGIINKLDSLGLFNLSTLAIGIFLSRLWYKYLQKKWEKEKIIISDPDILDDEIM